MKPCALALLLATCACVAVVDARHGHHIHGHFSHHGLYGPRAAFRRALGDAAAPEFSLGPSRSFALPSFIQPSSPDMVIVMSSSLSPSTQGGEHGVTSHESQQDLEDLMSFLQSLPAHVPMDVPHGELFAVPKLLPLGGRASLRGSPFGVSVVRQFSPDVHAPVPDDLHAILAAADSMLGDLMSMPSFTFSPADVMPVAGEEEEEGDHAHRGPCGSCGDDLATLCPGQHDSLYHALYCLKDHEDELSSSCKTLVAGDVSVVGSCFADIKAHCAGVQPGEGRVHTCLASHKPVLTSNCAAYVDMNSALTAVPVDADAPEAERADAEPQVATAGDLAPEAPSFTSTTAEVTAPAAVTVPTRPAHSPSSSLPTAAIVGICAAALVVVGAFVAVLVRRARLHSREAEDARYTALLG